MDGFRMSHAYPDTQLLIDGQWVDAASGKKIAVHNPATGAVIGHVAHAGIADLDRALAAAQKGFQVWKNTSAHERQATMRRAALLLQERADAIAAVLTQEQGKPLAEAKGEVLAGVGIIDWFADEALRLYGRIVPARRSDVLQQVVKEPVGPVAAFTPWNFPVNQIVRKISAALATGCSFLCKAPEETPAAPPRC
jgi:succinate-semialdehyde dehydrogenase/glutarate-semialdehyde dehydrogenase